MNQKPLNQPATLYVVATPIGNLGDMVPRAVEILHAVDMIAAEDTRHSAKLLAHFGVSTPMVAYHDHSDDHKVEQLLHRLQNGQSLALISDAGTPMISDPGYRLVQKVREAGIRVSPIPGACALVAALCASGMPSDRFSFEGFVPAKAVARKLWFEALKAESRTWVFYESTHRIVDSITALVEVLGAEREIAIARELTKTFETIHSGAASQVLKTLTDDPNQQRGEFVVMVKGMPPEVAQSAALDQAQAMVKVMLKEGLSVKQASTLGAKLTGAKKNALYQYALGLNEG